MKNLSFAAIVLLSSMALPIASATAQQRGGLLRPSTHALNPSMSLSAPAASPLQQQMQDNYATQLIQSQRDLLQQNPSGTTRQELAVGHELNGFSPH